jgi:hypothetical protein
MTWWKTFWTACVAILVGLAFWRNRKSYKRSNVWCLIKSLIDVALVLGMAFRLPMLLGAYVIMWLTKPLNHRPVLRIAYGALIGIAIAFLSGFAIEFVVLAGIFAIDMVTGGALRHWRSISAEKLDWRAEIFGPRAARKAA